MIFQSKSATFDKMPTIGLLGSIVLLSLAVGSSGAALRGDGSDSHTERELYESDDDKCMEDDLCRLTVGLVLICFAPVVICWNELAHVRLEQLYGAAQRVIRDLHNPFKTYDEDNDGDVDQQFVCFNGTLEGATALKDPLFPSSIQVDNALLLKREIEIFQYIEVGDNDSGYKLKEQWCRFPQPDPKEFPQNKNPVGNWDLFGGEQIFDTGRTHLGEPICFRENLVIVRAPNPTLGAFAVPADLLDEGFLGVRNVHRLHEYERIKESQGGWMDLKTKTMKSGLLIFPETPNGEKIKNYGGRHIGCEYRAGYFYDGEREKIGTIRIKWKFAPQQEATIAAEAVAPGRVATQGYGSMGHNLTSANPSSLMHMKDMIVSELFDGGEATREEMQPLWTGNASKDDMKMLADRKETEKNHGRWTLTPFQVTEPSCLPPYGNKFLGQLWLFAPGRLTSRELFHHARTANDKCLWIVRGVTYLMLLTGWMMMFGPLTRILGPGIFKSVLMFAFGLVAAVLATSCWVTFSALACCAARPARSTLFLAICWGLYVFWDQHYSEFVTGETPI